MTKITWETLGKPTMILSLGGIGLFRGKLINLCGNLTQISMRPMELRQRKILRLLNSLKAAPHLLYY